MICIVERKMCTISKIAHDKQKKHSSRKDLVSDILRGSLCYKFRKSTFRPNVALVCHGSDCKKVCRNGRRGPSLLVSHMSEPIRHIGLNSTQGHVWNLSILDVHYQRPGDISVVKLIDAVANINSSCWKRYLFWNRKALSLFIVTFVETHGYIFNRYLTTPRGSTWVRLY